MYCKNCGTKLDKDTLFCSKCGIKVGNSEEKQQEKNETNNKKKSRIKCIQCKYVGEGQKGRSLWAVILALLVLPFAWIITILYFLLSHKWICPKCKSKFVEEIDENGNVIKRRNILLIIFILIIGIAMMGILASIVLVSLGGAREKARDARRQSDIRQISLAMEIHYDDGREYLQSVKLPNVIGDYLIVPEDPGNGPCSSYQWISNISYDSQQYCTWACLEDGTFFAASERGTKILKEAPTSLYCWY